MRKNRSVFQKFVDLFISGRQEQPQAVPPRANRPPQNIRPISGKNPQAAFFRDMRRYAGQEGVEGANPVPFEAYWPTYDRMSTGQLQWYFSWRSGVRRGSYPDTDASYIFLHLYELLSGIGWDEPRGGWELLEQLWRAYRERCPKLDRYMLSWMYDFSLLHGLHECVPPLGIIPRIRPSRTADFFIAQYETQAPLKLHPALIGTLSDYAFQNSKFYKEGHGELLLEVLPRVTALADVYLRKTTAKGILETYGPSKAKKEQYFLFSDALCPEAGRRVAINVRSYSTYPALREFMKELVRFTENVLRGIYGFRGRLRDVQMEKELGELIKSFLFKAYGEPKQEAEQEQRPLELDFASISTLRQQSDAVRDALWVDTDAGASHETQEAPLPLPVSRILPEDCREGDSSKSGMGGTPSGENAPRFARALLPKELREFLDVLSPAQEEALYAVAVGQPQELERIAGEELTLPELLLDELNTGALEILGDIIIDACPQVPRLLEDYEDILQKAIVQEG